MRIGFLAVVLVLASPAVAQDMSAFTTGPVFKTFGPHAPVEETMERPADAKYAIAFDLTEPAAEGQRSRGIERAARFINMHVANGVDPANIHIAIVVHGRAALDLLGDEAWAAKGKGESNPSSAMLSEMLDKGVRVILCGQSAAAFGIDNAMLVPGVEMALSAMTAHALLQQQGYTVDPS